MNFIEFFIFLHFLELISELFHTIDNSLYTTITTQKLLRLLHINYLEPIHNFLEYAQPTHVGRSKYW